MPKIKVPLLSQNDPTWKSQRLGSSAYTIGSDGCLITCIAMVESYYKKESITPPMVNQRFKDSNGFSGALVNWATVPALLDFDYKRYDWEMKTADVGLLKTRIDQGKPTIIKVDSSNQIPDIQQHFVVVVGYTDTDLIINDAFTGEEYFLKGKYPASKPENNTLEKIVLGARILDKKEFIQIPQPIVLVPDFSKDIRDIKDKVSLLLNELEALKSGMTDKDRQYKELDSRLDKLANSLGSASESIKN